MSKSIKCTILTFALAAIVAFSAALAACDAKTDHPTAQLTISFAGQTYVIEYTLYRNMYPQTVEHFIELADDGFYDNMIVHDYKSGRDWFTGSYKYDEKSENVNYNAAYSGGINNLQEYLLENSKENDYYKMFQDGKLTPSVYKTMNGDDALPTLIGEFSANQHNIENGALLANLGSLKMFYYDKGNSNASKVSIKNTLDQTLIADYKYNCATSVFALQVGASTDYNSTNYCVFGQLKDDDALTVFESLIDAVKDYADANSDKFTTSVETTVDKLDTFAKDGEVEVTFTMTSMPIVIKKVEITNH